VIRPIFLLTLCLHTRGCAQIRDQKKQLEAEMQVRFTLRHTHCNVMATVTLTCAMNTMPTVRLVEFVQRRSISLSLTRRSRLLDTRPAVPPS
jgi:hypothetical protein